MTSAPGSAEFAALASAQDRRLEREGIPMYLALVSETAQPVPAPPDARVAEGRTLAGSLERFRQAVAPTQRDDDHGVYMSVMQAVSYFDFDASRLDGGDIPSAGLGGDDLIRPHGPRDEEAAL
jgi:hypothetical protein